MAGSGRDQAGLCKNVRITIPGPQRRDERERREGERVPTSSQHTQSRNKTLLYQETYLDILKLKVRVVLADIPGVHEALITV